MLSLMQSLIGTVPHQSSFFFPLIPFSIALQPLKTPIYGTLVGLLNAQDPELGRQLVSRSVTEFQKALDGGEYTAVKIWLRFFAELVNANAISATSFVKLVEQLLAVAKEAVRERLSHCGGRCSDTGVLTKQGTPANRSATFLHMVMLALPYAGRELLSLRPEELGRIMRGLDGAVAARRAAGAKPNPLLSVFADQPVRRANCPCVRCSNLCGSGGRCH